MTPFEWTFRVEMRHAGFVSIQEVIKKEHVEWYVEQRKKDRKVAKEQIFKRKQSSGSL